MILACKYVLSFMSFSTREVKRQWCQLEAAIQIIAFIVLLQWNDMPGV